MANQKIPAQVRPWLPYLTGICGHDPEKLWQGDTTIQINAPLALIEMGAQAQIDLLRSLHAHGLLKRPPRIKKGEPT